MVDILSEKRFDDSGRSELSPRDWSLSFSLLAESRCRESLLGALSTGGQEWSSGPVIETTGMGESRLTNGSAASLLMFRSSHQVFVMLVYEGRCRFRG